MGTISARNLDLAVDHTAARHGDSHITILLETAVDVKGHIALLGDDGGVLDYDVAAVVGHRICAVRSGHTAAVDDHAVQRQVAIVLEYHGNPGVGGIHGAAFHRDLAAREQLEALALRARGTGKRRFINRVGKAIKVNGQTVSSIF